MFNRKKDGPTIDSLGEYPAVTVSAELVPFIEELEQVSADLRALHDRMLQQERAEAEERRRLPRADP